MSTRRSLGRLLAWPALLLVGCNAISGVDQYVVDDDDSSDAKDAGTGSDARHVDGSSDVDTNPPPRDAAGEESVEAGDVLHVFVTSTKTWGSFGGPSGGDGICRDRAREAGRTGTWVAWLSTSSSSSAASRLSSKGPWYLFNGHLAVASAAQLTSGSISAPIDVDEKGTDGIADGVWTGTSASGASKSDCDDWALSNCIGTCNGMTGRTNSPSAGWTGDGDQECLAANLRLYCFQN